MLFLNILVVPLHSLKPNTPCKVWRNEPKMKKKHTYVLIIQASTVMIGLNYISGNIAMVLLNILVPSPYLSPSHHLCKVLKMNKSAKTGIFPSNSSTHCSVAARTLYYLSGSIHLIWVNILEVSKYLFWPYCSWKVQSKR